MARREKINYEDLKQRVRELEQADRERKQTEDALRKLKEFPTPEDVIAGGMRGDLQLD